VEAIADRSRSDSRPVRNDEHFGILIRRERTPRWHVDPVRAPRRASFHKAYARHAGPHEQ
jgi:hypothetical protein